MIMPMKEAQTVVISVGGSLIVPSKGDGSPDTTFLSELTKFVERIIAKDMHLVLIAGGGKTARLYQHTLKGLTPADEEDYDWIGIHSTRLNGQLLKIVLKEYADEHLVTNPDELPDTDKPIIVGAGYKPGASTDLRAVQIAKNLGAKCVVNLSNIDYAYTDDPNDNPDAKKIENMSWDEFLDLIPYEWSPGLNSPFDPVASREAQSAGMEVAIINGNKLEEVEKFLNGDTFIGSVIH